MPSSHFRHILLNPPNFRGDKENYAGELHNEIRKTGINVENATRKSPPWTTPTASKPSFVRSKKPDAKANRKSHEA